MSEEAYRVYRKGFCYVPEDQLRDLTDFARHHGFLNAARHLGVNHVTLQNAVEGRPIRGETYVKLLNGYEAYVAKGKPSPTKSESTLDPDDIRRLQEICDRHGMQRAAGYLGLNHITLHKAARGLRIRQDTYRKIIQSLDLYDADPPEPAIAVELSTSEYEAIQQYAAQWGKARTAAKLSLAFATLERILYGERKLRANTLKKVQDRLKRIAAEPVEQPPTPSVASEPDQDETLEEQLLIWLQDVKNRRICRELLAKAQRKHK